MKVLFLFPALIAACLVFGQNQTNTVNAKEVERIERSLSADDMQGRKAGTAGNAKAAAFIVNEFKKIGLVPLKGNDYLQEFSMVRARLSKLTGEIDDKEISTEEIIPISMEKDLKVDEKSGYALEYVKERSNIQNRVQEIMGAQKNTVVFIDKSFSNIFPRLKGFNRQAFKDDKTKTYTVIFVLGNYEPKKFSFKIENEIEEVKLANAVGMLPGKNRWNEYVIFSGHYDHLGIGQPQNDDSIYNGANDDAAGTTAVIMLADYFKQLNNNERTLVFAAFTAEEIGGFGSQYFSKQFDPTQVVAMFNIEMIGTESKWGRNSAYMTGFEKTDMGKIMQQNLKGTPFTFYPDPYPEQDLFYRSDNATLARLGVPAHSISTSKMDSEKYYHTVDDEIGTLDVENMAAIIKAIAESSKTIISGKDTPTRVNTSDLR